MLVPFLRRRYRVGRPSHVYVPFSSTARTPRRRLPVALPRGGVLIGIHEKASARTRVDQAPCLGGHFEGCARPTKGLCYLSQGKEVEAEKLVPHVGSFWGGWSQWCNRLPHEEQGGG
jgi:hypothetical protein